MARTRNIKPGFFKNEALGELEPLARLLFAGMWCWADREGRLADRPKRLRAEILPYDGAADGVALVAQLEAAGLIARYAVGEEGYIQIVHFARHQNPHVREPASTLPAPPWEVPAPDEPGASPVPALFLNGTGPANHLPLTTNHSPLEHEEETAWQYTHVGSDEPTPARPDPRDDFEEFWAAYPRTSSGKGRARVAYRRLIARGVPAADLLAAARHYAAYVAVRCDDPRHIKHGATFLEAPADDWRDYVAGPPPAEPPGRGRGPPAFEDAHQTRAALARWRQTYVPGEPREAAGAQE